MPSVIVLGAGRVGTAVTADLAAESSLDVAAADADTDALRRLKTALPDGAVRTLPVDLSDAGSLARILDGHDLAIGALPGTIGFDTLRRVLEAGTDIVDSSFFARDALELHDHARRRGRVAIVDAGLAPGLGGLILGHWESRLAATRRFTCHAGGIPADPSPPWGYTAHWNPRDLLAGYTRPARLRRDGEELTMPALSEVEEIEIPDVGRLEAFNTDSLRTLLRTSAVPDLSAKTLRWPGHAERVRLLRDAGFLAETPLELDDDVAVIPLDVSARLLADAWRPDPDEPDLAVLRVEVEGETDDGPVRHTYSLLDRSDPETGLSATARTTAFTATALARFVLAGGYREPGISPPEVVGATEGALDFVLARLRERGVAVEHMAE